MNMSIGNDIKSWVGMIYVSKVFWSFIVPIVVIIIGGLFVAIIRFKFFKKKLKAEKTQKKTIEFIENYKFIIETIFKLSDDVLTGKTSSGILISNSDTSMISYPLSINKHFLPKIIIMFFNDVDAYFETLKNHLEHNKKGLFLKTNVFSKDIKRLKKQFKRLKKRYKKLLVYYYQPNAV